MVKEAIQNLVTFCRKMADQPIYPTGPTGSAYLDGLVRVSPDGEARGSYVEGLDNLDSTISFLNSLEFEQVEVDPSIQYKTCQYFQAPVPDGMVAWQNIMLYMHIINQNDVQIRNGKHGEELVLPCESGKMPTNTISLIVEDGMMSTWYPGTFTARSPDVIPSDRNEWNPHWAVKLI